MALTGPVRRWRARQLATAVRTYVRHGWTITAGSYELDGRCACDRTDCRGRFPHPAFTGMYCSDGTAISPWQSRWPPAILVEAKTFDVLVLAAHQGAVLFDRLASARYRPGPVAVMRRDGQVSWVFLTHAADEMRSAVEFLGDVTVVNGWTPLPPSRWPGGRARWYLPPWEVGWRLWQPDLLYGQLHLIVSRTTWAGTPPPRYGGGLREGGERQ